ncbi:MAG: hypothetical protein ABSG65_11415 [Bryobacteraceae bacterium]|jgi:hypothetical protein
MPRRRAPTERRIPISRVRCSMLASMTFIATSPLRRRKMTLIAMLADWNDPVSRSHRSIVDCALLMPKVSGSL